MRFVAVGHDYLQSEIIKKLALELKSRGHEAVIFVGDGKQLTSEPPEMEEAVSNSEVVLVTISNRTDEEVSAGLMAVKHNKPLIVSADAFRSYSMPAFAPLRFHTRILFRTTGDRAEDARNLFPNAEIHVVGNPFWEAWANPEFSRNEVREKFEVEDDECFIACAGDKPPGDNIMLFGCLLEAVEVLQKRGIKTKLLIGFHPGASLPPSFYHGVFRRSDIPVMFTGPETMSLSDAVVGADMVINTVSTIGIQAAYQHVPSINFMSIFTRTMLARDTGEDTWDLCDNLGISRAVRGSSVEELMEVISEFAKTGFSSLSAKRDIVFPVSFVPGKCIHLMANTIERLT